jgi:hypothetical protein
MYLKLALYDIRRSDIFLLHNEYYRASLAQRTTEQESAGADGEPSRRPSAGAGSSASDLPRVGSGFVSPSSGAGLATLQRDSSGSVSLGGDSSAAGDGGAAGGGPYVPASPFGAGFTSERLNRRGRRAGGAASESGFGAGVGGWFPHAATKPTELQVAASRAPAPRARSSGLWTSAARCPSRAAPSQHTRTQRRATRPR